jgi:scyllo-inositol 2-dehydrogenase (NADP+)
MFARATKISVDPASASGGARPTGEDCCVRVALLGYGLAGRVFHRPLITATPGLQLATVVTSDRRREEQARHDLHGVVVLSSAEALWERRDAHDLVVVATPTGTHASVAGAALDAGLDVVVDKPLAVGATQARELANRATRAGRMLVPFHNRRWDADHLTLRRLLGEGLLGDVHRYEARFERWRPGPVGTGWRETLPPRQGGGILLDLGVHLVDQALALFGSVRSVYAEVDAQRGGTDDDVFVALAHDSGVHSHLWAGSLVGAPGPRLRVLGSEGAYVHRELDGQEDALAAGTRPDDPGYGVEPPASWGRLHRGKGANGSDDAGEAVPSERGRWPAFYVGLVAALRDGAEPPVRVEDALAGLAVLDAARQSASSGRVVAPLA